MKLSEAIGQLSKMMYDHGGDLEVVRPWDNDRITGTQEIEVIELNGFGEVVMR